MPELPEVEYVTRQLRTELVGRCLVQSIVYWSGNIGDMDPAEFGRQLAGARISEIDRRGKYLVIRLDNDRALIIHRGMSGNLLIGQKPTDALYVRVAFLLDDGRYLLYSDPRKFGRLYILPVEKLATRFGGLGPEPLEETFTADMLAAKVAGTTRAIKTVLLDQSVVAGLGNIYADEALFEARIHPLRAANSLTRDEIEALAVSIPKVLRAAIEHGGTTFGRHRDVYNRAGTNLNHVQVYRRTNQPCPRCGSAIRRIVLSQRGTHFCPTCQRLPG